MRQILIVEDDEKLNHGIRLAFRNEFSCLQAFSLKQASDLYKAQGADLIILDVNLPDGSGIDFMTELRKTDDVPVILLTANKLEMDIVSGLELGANDYVTKPFSLMVLRARVGVQLRKEKASEGVYRDTVFFFDFDKCQFMRENETLELSRTEQKLLRCLTMNKGKSLSRSRLIDDIWQGDTEYVEEHALTVVVNRLRSKLGGSPECIKTVYGVGYTWTGI